MLPIHFAPLQGYTDHVYRTLHARLAGGVSMYYTPFVRWEKGAVRNKDLRDIEPENNIGTCLTPQIICGTTDDFKRLADIIQQHGHQCIDINMGCPAPMQTKLSRGSGILPHPELVEALMAEVARRPEVHFSVKMRLGLDAPDEWTSILPILNEAPLQHITIHPRVGKQMYKGEVNTVELQAFAQQCKHPLIYNGDVKSVHDIQRIEQQLPSLSAIMIGRGLLARPTLAKEYEEGCEWSYERRRQVILAMHDELLAFCTEKYKADSQVLLHIHAFWEYQESELGRKAWKKIMKAGSMRNYLAAVRDI